MTTLILVFAAVFCLELILVLMLTLMPKLGGLGKDIIGAFTQTPWLDLLLSIMLWIPWLASVIIAGWSGLFSALLAQFIFMQLWCFIHELAHSDYKKEPKIYSFLNNKIGWWRNNLALWVTTIVFPVFFLIRFAEIFVYPMLVWLLGFPSYKQSEWVNVSRQKFQGLIGRDLIWCLYCDWMTGVYSLGAEMLRNVESFWCPIRFYDGKKCENCKIDFPDIEGGWVAADGNMTDVKKVLESEYNDQYRSWFNHPERQSKQQ
jgi:hypothetical protein